VKIYNNKIQYGKKLEIGTFVPYTVCADPGGGNNVKTINLLRRVSSRRNF